MTNRNTSRRVLFVCMGNICRSPTGEAVFRKLVQDRGLADRIAVDSAGTIGYHAGHPPDARMRRAAAARGYHLEGTARQIRENDLNEFDLVIAMDRDNHRDLCALDGQGRRAHKIRLLSEFVSDEWGADVPDPYYGGEEGFHYVLKMIEEACPPILEHVLALDAGTTLQADR